MEVKITNQPEPQSRIQGLENPISRVYLADVFDERKGSYLNEFILFIAHFNTIPHFVHEIKIDCKRAIKWFEANYRSEIRDLHYFKRYFNGRKVM